MKDITKLHNPYDFANPVSDESLFFGRQAELGEIDYYLDLAAHVKKPISLAILGPRASGKTSLLNMTEQTAQKMDFCTVRVNLDEGDVLSEMRFFHKLFNSLLTSACKSGAFGGIAGRTYDIYLDMISSYALPIDPDHAFSPFLFPISYAKAMAAGNVNMPLLDFAYTDDLRRIAEATAKPILILFDEGNVLAKSRVHLEKMRNIFMNLSRFMIVIAGTADLFPIMDEVFSPMVRQFKRIIVGEFKSEEETELCVREPLRTLGLQYMQRTKIAPSDSIGEIHELSGGRPYEVQLICHVLFRRVQSGRAGKMSLDVSSLDEIRKELETSQSLVEKPLLTRIRTLSKTELAALMWFFLGTGATFDRLWSIEYFLDGERTWKREQLKELFEAFTREGILKDDEGIVRFEGDEFARLYARYLARERGARRPRIDISPVSGAPDFLATIRITFAIRQRLHLQFLILGDNTEELSAIEDIGESLGNPASSNDIFVEYPELMSGVYFLMFAYRMWSHIPMIQISIALPGGLRTSNLYFARNPSDSGQVDAAVSHLEDLRRRAEEIGGQFNFASRKIKVAPVEQLILCRDKTANRSLRESLIHRLIDLTASTYCNDKNLKESLFLADLAFRDLAELNSTDCNNLGYVFLSADDLSKARELFEEAFKRCSKLLGTESKTSMALANYNLAMVEIKSNELLKAVELLRNCCSIMEETAESELPCRCLFVPHSRDGAIVLEETFESPELYEIAKEALIAVSQVLQ